MDRRKFLVGMGSLAAGGAAVLGSGAFTTVDASRTVDVAVVDDSQALLGLDARTDNANRAYADESGDVVTVDLSANAEAAGINDNATTTIYDIFSIENQGTRDAVVYADPATLQNQGAFEEGSDGIYFDPQFSDMPNDGDSALGTLPDGTKFGSLSGVGGSVEDFETDLFESNSEVPYSPETFVLSPGQSFDFGIYVRTNSADSAVTFDVDIVASAPLAEKANS